MFETEFRSLKWAQGILGLQNREQKDAALKSVHAAIDKARADILAANAADVEKARM